MTVNPFHLTTLQRPEWFYNRKSEVRDALEILRDKGNVEVLGPRKIGKTWFLRYIRHSPIMQQYGLDPQRHICVYIDCQHRSIQEEETQVYLRMLDCLEYAARRTGIDFVPKAFGAASSGIAFEQMLKEMHLRGLSLILLMDEFESMAQNSKLNDIFFNHLRSLALADDVDIRYVTASATPTVDFDSRRDRWSSPFFNIFQPVRLGLFNQQDSRHLVEDVLSRANASFPGDLVDLVLEAGGRHPYFLQLAGHHAFRLAASGERLTEGEREAFLRKFHQEAARHFGYYWARLDKKDQIILTNLPSPIQDLFYGGAFERLEEKGLVVKRSGQYDHFSTSFREFVRRQNVQVDSTSLIGRTLGIARIVEKISSNPKTKTALYKAYQSSLDRYVATKILFRQPQNEDLWQRFPQEARAIANLEHPNILPVYDFGQKEDLAFIVMQYVPGEATLAERLRNGLEVVRMASAKAMDGGLKKRQSDQRHLTRLRRTLARSFGDSDLRDLFFDLGLDYDDLPGESKRDKARELLSYCEKHDRLPELIQAGERVRSDISWYDISDALLEAMRLVIQIAQALHYAHERDIIHCDIKPANILIAPDSRPLLADFGLARTLTDSTPVDESSMTGTAAYTAPEQLDGSGVDARSDIYALGTVLYEMVTGRLPFEAANEGEIIVKKIQESPPEPRQFNPELPQDVENVILKAIARRPNDRFQNAMEMMDALHAVIN